MRKDETLDNGMREFVVLIVVLILVSGLYGERGQAQSVAYDILATNHRLIDTLAANSSACYEIPISQTSLFKMELVVNRLSENPLGTLEVYMSRNGFTPTKKSFDYSATSGSPWIISFEDGAEYSLLWTACLYSSSFPITYDIQAGLSAFAPTPISLEATNPVMLQPGHLAVYQMNITYDQLQQPAWIVNVTVGNGNRNGIKIMVSGWSIPIRGGEWNGYGYVALFPNDEQMWVALLNKGQSTFSGDFSVHSGELQPQVITIDKSYHVDLNENVLIMQIIVSPLPDQQYTMLKLAMDVADGDPDLYVSAGYIPTFGNYDFHDTTWGDKFEINSLVLQTTTYYLLWDAYDEDSSGTFKASLHSFQIPTATNNTVMTFVGSSTELLYLRFQVPAEFSGTGYVLVLESQSWTGKSSSLFVRSEKIPSRGDYDYHSWLQDEGFNSLMVPGPEAGDWYVMVDSSKVKGNYTMKISVLPLVLTELNGAGIVNRSGDRDDELSFYFKYTVTDSIDYLTIASDVIYSDLEGSWGSTTASKVDVYSNSPYGSSPAITIPSPNGTWYFEFSGPYAHPFALIGVGAKVSNLTLDCSATTDSGQAGQWKYYSIYVDKLEFADIEITTLVSSGLNLYVLADHLPSVLKYDYLVSGSRTSKISFYLPPTHIGPYFLGLYMTATTTFTLSVCPKLPNLPSLGTGVTYNRTLDSIDDYYYVDVVSSDIDYLVVFVNDSTQVNVFVAQGVLPDVWDSWWQHAAPVNYLFTPSVGRYFLAVHKVSTVKTDYNPHYTIRCVMKNKDQVAIPLESGKPTIATVAAYDIAFFSIFVGNASTPVTAVVTPITEAYLSLVVQYGTLPNLTNYLYSGYSRNSRTIAAFTPSNGMYYFSVMGSYYSSKAVLFSIEVTFDSNRAPISLDNGIQKKFQMNNNLWKDFTIDVEFGSMFMIQYPKIPVNSDVVVYVKFQGLPSTQDYLKKSSPGSSIIYITEPDYGTYYVSVFCGNQSLSSFPFSLTTFIGGSCGDKTGCLCPDGRDDCSQIISGLQDGAVYNGFVDEDSWVHYRMDIERTTDLVINFQTSFATRDQVYCYVRYGDLPTNTSYDYVMSLNPSQRSLTVMDPQYGVLYISVYGEDVIQYAKYSITTSLVDFGSCVNHCSGHGSCSSSVCSCNAGWTGADCSIYQEEITSEVAFDTTGHLRGGYYNYFTVVGSPLTSSSLDLYVQVQLSGSMTSGAVQLYVKVGDDFPTTASFDLSSTNGTSDLVVVPKMKSGKTVKISVYCNTGPIDYAISILPVEAPSHSSAVLIVFMVLLVVFLFVGGYYFFNKNRETVLPVIQRLTSGTSSSHSSRSEERRRGRGRGRGVGLLEDQDEDELEDEGTRSRISKEDAFASALTRAVADGEEGEEGRERDEEEGQGFKESLTTSTSTTTTSSAPAATTTGSIDDILG